MVRTKLKQISVLVFICLILGTGVVLLSSAGQVETGTDTPAADVIQPGSTENTEEAQDEKESPIVYMTSDISSGAMVRIYEILERDLPGKVAVKLSTGEPGGNYFLNPDLIKDLVHEVNGTIVECNTAYGGPRASSAMHKQVFIDHGFAAIAPTDLLDEDGEISIPFPEGVHLQEDFVGSHFTNYDSYLVLTHFKGHAMGGFGGALKNISIGFASAEGKAWIHSAGKNKKLNEIFAIFGNTPQDDFLESMAEGAGAVMKAAGNNIVYVSVMNNLSVDCDCDGSPAEPTMANIGILASLDPVALDQACVDLVYKAHDGHDLIERMESRNGIHILEHAGEIGIGSREYNLVSIDG